MQTSRGLAELKPVAVPDELYPAEEVQSWQTEASEAPEYGGINFVDIHLPAEQDKQAASEILPVVPVS